MKFCMESIPKPMRGLIIQMITTTGLTPTSNPDTNTYYYISYNAIESPNTGTLMGGNAVLVHHSDGVGRSELVAQL